MPTPDPDDCLDDGECMVADEEVFDLDEELSGAELKFQASWHRAKTVPQANVVEMKRMESDSGSIQIVFPLCYGEKDTLEVENPLSYAARAFCDAE